MNIEELLGYYRRVMNHIHEAGNIHNDRARFEAYGILAKLASDLRRFGK